jgi:hypothetical protein
MQKLEWKSVWPSALLSVICALCFVSIASPQKPVGGTVGSVSPSPSSKPGTALVASVSVAAPNPPVSQTKQGPCSEWEAVPCNVDENTGEPIEPAPRVGVETVQTGALPNCVNLPPICASTGGALLSQHAAADPAQYAAFVAKYKINLTPPLACRFVQPPKCGAKTRTCQQECTP